MHGGDWGGEGGAHGGGVAGGRCGGHGGGGGADGGCGSAGGANPPPHSQHIRLDVKSASSKPPHQPGLPV